MPLPFSCSIARPLAAWGLCAGMLPGALAAQALPARVSAAVSAPVSNVQYEVRFDRETAAAQRIHVRTRFATDGTGPVLLSLPAWTPGAYELSYFARWVSGFAAHAGERALDWDKVDHDTWRIEPAGAREITIAFDYRADSLDTAMAWSRADFAFFNGTNLFLYPEGRPLDFRSVVRIATEADWRIATGMHETAPRTYEAASYHDLVDMPTFVGRFDYDSTRIAGSWIRLATYPAGSVAGAARRTVWDQLRRIVPVEAAVFGGVPWGPHYTILQVADSSSEGASGLEHQNSHLDIVAPVGVGSIPLAGLYAHEIFHAWNVKRLRPQELWPYVYDRMQPTELLWMAEGITDYYADLALVRGGVTDVRQFYATVEGKATAVAVSAPVALEDASLSTWIAPTDGTAYLYYDKGSLAGLLLDVLIRDATDNRGSLDAAMRELYEREYGGGSGFTAAELWAALERAAGGRSLAEFRARYVDGRDPYPYESVLALAGLRARVIRAPRLGVGTRLDGDSIRVTTVDPGSAAAAAGVRTGDVLLRLGDLMVNDPNFGERYRSRYARAAEGTPLPIRVARAGAVLTLPAVVRYGTAGVTIDEDPAASPRARRIRDGILLGTSR